MAITLDGTNGVTTPNLTVDTTKSTVQNGGSVSAPAYGIITGALGVNGTYVPAANTLGFVAGGAERGRFTANGLTFNGDTAAVNALDDYEEGSLSLGVSLGTASFNFLRYTKVGNVCTLGFLVNTFSDTTSASQIAITGLPFAAANDTQAMGTTIITSVNSGRSNLVSYINQGSSTMNFYASGNNSAYVGVQYTMLSSTSQIYQSITYQTV